MYFNTKSILLCLFFLFNSFIEIFCIRNLTMEQCGKIKLQFGRTRYRQRGRIAKFICNTGYVLAGEKYSICSHGKWDSSIPKCVRGTCAPAKSLKNGLIYPSHGGGVLNFYCTSGYELRGTNITYCDGKNWDKATPSCLPTNTTPPLSCDFEHEDICGWSHDLNNDLEWTRMNFETPSGNIGTGPKFDHTKGKGKDGYYMYIESSMRNENDTARLISPLYSKTNSNICFEFYYHMYGLTTGSLRAYVKKINDTWAFDREHAFFTKTGNQGDHWYRSYTFLGKIDTDFQIVIEGVRGPGYVSDTAIDDVKIVENCTEPSEEDETTTTDLYSTTTEILPVLESCQNRCNIIDNDTPSNYVLSCDCDVDCYDNNRCCPDYFDFCLETTSPEITTTEIITTTRKQTPKTTPKRLIHYITETILKTTPSDVEEVPISSYEDRNSDGEDYEVFVAATNNDNANKEKESISSDKIVIHDSIITTGHVKTIVFVVGVVFGALFALVGMAFVVKRYNLVNCRRQLGRMNHSGNGDSQSDVRFLTSDEVLDLNLPRDYEDY